MKRDMDLVRQILLQMEENDRIDRSVLIEMGYSRENIQNHLLLLKNGGFLICKGVYGDRTNPKGLEPVFITWQGYEFLELSRDDSNWEKAKTAAGEVGSFAMDVLLKILTSIVMETLKPQIGL